MEKIWLRPVLRKMRMKRKREFKNPRPLAYCSICGEKHHIYYIDGMQVCRRCLKSALVVRCR